MKKIINLFAFALLTTVFSSCVNETFKIEQDNCVEPGLLKTKDVQEIFNEVPVTATLYTKDDVIQGVVTSSNEGGNFFKSLSLMSLDGSRGFTISVDEYNLENIKLQPGRIVFIKLKGLHTAKPTGGAIGLNIGGPPSGQFNTLSRLYKSEMFNHIYPTCKILNEDDFVKKVTVAQLNNDAFLNALVEIDNVQFENEETTTYGVNANVRPELSDKNETVTDGANVIISRTSKFSNFAGSTLPKGNGKMRAVLTKFNGTFQLVFRTERDVMLNNPRKNFDLAGGTNIQFLGNVLENFESYNVGIKSFPNYINYAFIGSRYWQTKTFSSNKFIEMSTFNGTTNPGVEANVLFMVPVNFDLANTFTFKKLIRFNRGTALKVSYVKESDYVFGSVPDKAKFVDITSSLNVPYPNNGASDSSFDSVVPYNIPATLTGNGYFVFENIGDSVNTTTIQIDDIVIN